MTQTLYAHMNKQKKKRVNQDKKNSDLKSPLKDWGT
jgi:hypothetical protein